jgi:hypothetical protein
VRRTPEQEITMHFAAVVQASARLSEWHALNAVQRALAGWPAFARITVALPELPAVALPAAALRSLCIAEMVEVGLGIRGMGVTDLPAAEACREEADAAVRETLG